MRFKLRLIFAIISSSEALYSLKDFNYLIIDYLYDGQISLLTDIYRY